MFHKKRLFSVLTCSLALTILCCTTIATIVWAASNYIPSRYAEGNIAVTIAPNKSADGMDAEVVTPTIKSGNSSNAEEYVPDFVDSEPFIDLESSYDFSIQYDYDNYTLSHVIGNCSFSDGTYTATTDTSIYANLDDETAFPYGTISADIMNNGGDTGFVFGLSTLYPSFWEGSGVTYYFAFINWEGVLFLGSTNNGVWNTLVYCNIPAYNATKTYNLKVVYRINKLVICLDDTPMLTYRTTNPFTGINWGIRTGAIGATVGNIEISSKATLD